MQQASKSLCQSQALALKAEVTEILKKAGANKSNLSKHEQKAINNLRKDENIVITPADKDKALVVMDKIEYVRKMEETLLYNNIRENGTRFHTRNKG